MERNTVNYMHTPHGDASITSFRTEIPPKSNLQRTKGEYRLYFTDVMRGKEGGDYRSRSMSRPHSYARKSTTSVQHGLWDSSKEKAPE